MRLFAAAVVLLAFLALLPGCPPLSVGACRYGDSGGQDGTVEVLSVSPPEGEGQWAYVPVEVRGLFNRTIGIQLDKFTECFEAPGYGVGSVVPARVIYGGPCPAMDQLADCPPTS